MDSFQFQPKLHNLEDRLTPTITPFDVFQALEQTREAQQQIRQILDYFSGPVNVYAQSYFATVFPSIVDNSIQSAVVLNEFQTELANQITANPTDSRFARELIGGVGSNLAVSYDNITKAEGYGVGLGAAPYAVRNPAAVPPVAPPVTPPTVPPIVRDESGMTSTIPSLTAPDWQPVGTAGLRVWDVEEGTGDIVTDGQDITLHYTGWLRNGTVFDSSRASLATRTVSGEPVEFNLNGLIEGWQIAIPGMRAGGIRRLDIPAVLAYGESGSPPSIPPNADLVFEIKLFESKDPAAE